MRKGFNLIMAIFMLLVLSGITVLTLKYVSIGSKHFADSYLQEQAEIFLQSVVEATLLEIEGHERDGTSCNSFVKRKNFISANNMFDANVTIDRYYLYEGKDNNGTTYYIPAWT